MKNGKGTGIRYSDEFKQTAIQKVENGESIRAVAKEMGIAPDTLRRWIKEKESLFASKEQSYIRYIQELKMRIEILEGEKNLLTKLLFKQVNE